MQARTEKTKMEFANIKAETLDEGTKTISQATYDKINEKTKEILARFGLKKQDNKATSPLTTLLELERKIEEADAALKHFTSSEENQKMFTKTLGEVKKEVKGEKTAAELERQKLEREAEAKRQAERQKDKIVVRDVHPQMLISVKKRTVQKKEKKQELTQEQKDMKKYGGEALFAQFMAMKSQI